MHLLGLTAFAIAQPVFDVLGRHPTFFVAHDVGRLELIAFTSAIVLVPTLALFAVAELVRVLAVRLANLFYVGLVGVLVALTLLPLMGKLGIDAPAGLVGSIAGCAMVAAVSYAVLPQVRWFFSIVGLFAIVSPGLFLSGGSIRPLLAAQPMAVSGAVVQHPAPIVLLVLDGLRLVELLDERGDIDAARYPNFGRLARMSTWYRNATSVAAFTHEAVPAILTGRRPSANVKLSPSASEHAENLFTLLGGAYDLVVYEPVTALCPESLCHAADDRDPPGRSLRLYVDATVVWLHIVLPPPFRAYLPDLTAKWSGFGDQLGEVGVTRAPKKFENALTSEDRSAAFVRSLDLLASEQKLQLFFHHSMLPHNPFEYFPSGERYRLPPQRLRTPSQGYDWSEDPDSVRFEEGLYVLQLAHVDHLLGALLDRLEQLGIIDTALVVVTADHGFAFVPGRSQRHYLLETAADIVPVPLFIKAPGQMHGEVSGKDVETIDILPTIAQIVGVQIPWAVDGLPVSSSFDDRSKSFLGNTVVAVKSMAAERELALARKVASVGSGGTPYDVLYDGATPRSRVTVDSKGATPSGPYAVELRRHGEAGDDAPSSMFIDGILIGPRVPSKDDRVLVTIDGRVAAASAVFPSTISQYYAFEALLDERVAADASDAGPEILYWDAESRSLRRPLKISNAFDVAETSADLAGSLWRNVWSGSPRAFACSRRIRELFAAQYSKPSETHSRAPYEILKNSVRECYGSARAVDDGGAAAAAVAAQECECEPFGDADATLSVQRATRPAAFAVEEEEMESDHRALWQSVWEGSEIEVSCSDMVRGRFSRLFRAVQSSASEVIIAPYEILNAAVLTCSMMSSADTPDGEGGVVTVPGIDACSCGPFAAADSSSDSLEASPDSRLAKVTAVENKVLVTHLKRNGLL